jgi:signal transduction histidine kinase/CheY-like chemotaxis protein
VAPPSHRHINRVHLIMKKPLLVVILLAVVIITSNFLVISDIYKKQISYQKDILFGQADLCDATIENTLLHFESDLNSILFSDDISVLFSEESDNSQPLRKLELFYSAYNNLIKNIDIYDNDKNVFNLFKDKQFITDKYIAQRQRKLADKEQVKIEKNEYEYFIPVFNNNQLYGNIVVTVNLTNYILTEMKKFHVEDISYQWVIDPESLSYSTNFPGKNLKIENFEEIITNLRNGSANLTKHRIVSDSIDSKVVTVYKLLDVLDHKFGLAFSLDNSYFIDKIFTRLIFLVIGSLLLISLLIFYLLSQIHREEKKKLILEKENLSIQEILQNLPIGVIVFNNENKIRYINIIAREMFLIKEDQTETGNTISEKYLLAGRKFKGEGKPSAYDVNQFILYEKEGNEIILYRKEYPYFIDGQENTLSAFIDITPLEKARKYEAASNTAKSEFLAKMSHEIRTPMNGIIGMTDALDKDNLTPGQKEYVEIIKRSADLLLNIIDDILDYSKIEAGKMQLEEIPFKLSEEVKLSLDLFRSIIEEKGLKLKVSIGDEVPDDIIGDPFRLRQVLSNLISNAVKFTHEGEIQLEVKLDEKYNGNLTLLFEVIDTGTGIPNERLESIFNSFTQAEQSTSRKYGGTGLGTTISKQLVNLMHGEIWVESPSGISKNKKYPGSKFSFTIEVYSNEEISKNLDFSQFTSFNEISAFIISQNVAVRKRISGFLEHLGIKVGFAEFEEGTEIIQSLSNQLKEKEYQVVFILDEQNLDGIWVARQLQHLEIIDRYRVIMISSKHKQQNYVQTKVAKVDYYLIQPFEQTILKSYLFRWFPGIQMREQERVVTLQKELNILVAEDNTINQKVAETIFSNLGYKIDLAIDGKEVVEKVKKKNYDIIFMDLQMPEMDGMDATVEIRGSGFQMPIIAMTATASKIGKDNAIISGMNDYITKPVKVDAVKSVLQKWFS